MDRETFMLIQRLLARLERISADSVWAHRASGLRGSLLRALDAAPAGPDEPQAAASISSTINAAHHILEQAARERVR